METCLNQQGLCALVYEYFKGTITRNRNLCVSVCDCDAELGCRAEKRAFE